MSTSDAQPFVHLVWYASTALSRPAFELGADTLKGGFGGPAKGACFFTIQGLSLCTEVTSLTTV